MKRRRDAAEADFKQAKKRGYLIHILYSILFVSFYMYRGRVRSPGVMHMLYSIYSYYFLLLAHRLPGSCVKSRLRPHFSSLHSTALLCLFKVGFGRISSSLHSTALIPRDCPGPPFFSSLVTGLLSCVFYDTNELIRYM